VSEYLNTLGRNRLSVGICGRCSLKFALDDLEPDVNYPGLLVCKDDSDWYDPYRLPPHETEDITLDMPRPDTAIVAPLSLDFWTAGSLVVHAGSLFYTAGAPATDPIQNL
jgi:hypothetical protein